MRSQEIRTGDCARSWEMGLAVLPALLLMYLLMADAPPHAQPVVVGGLLMVAHEGGALRQQLLVPGSTGHFSR